MTKKTETELLKIILENLRSPQRLDEHPWATRPFVRDFAERNGGAQADSPGRRLAAALCELFPKTMPGTPPRRGKRLDNHWGEFGLLAALYFAPLELGLPAPHSLRDAWGRIDPSILFYVYGKDGNRISQEQREAYRLVGGEPEVAPISTLSDWHCKGIEKLAGLIAAYEGYLQTPLGGSPGSMLPRVEAEPAAKTRRIAIPVRAVLLICGAALAIALALGALKGMLIYRAAMPVQEDLAALRGAASEGPSLDAALNAGPLLARTRQDVAVLSEEVEPVLWLGDWLGWLPVYGGDLRQSRELLSLAGLVLESADEAYTAARPLLGALKEDPTLSPPEMVALLSQARPGLLRAADALERAVQVRSGLEIERLSPRARALVEDRLDPLLPLMGQALDAGTALPRLLGAASDGPRTYLLLAQNEDELRPTGGFITAVGTLVVQNGEILQMSFVDSGELENWDRPYPAAPWQLQQYMNSPVLILRDANWFPDFPTSALYVETLYAYSRSHSVDGVIAFDQHTLVLLLEAVGPIQVDGETVTAANVLEFMRAAKEPPIGLPVPADWKVKAFINRIATSMLTQLFEGDTSWEALASALLQGLDERHILLQVDDERVASIVAERGWDGRLRRADGDFLMVVDSNLGFNKTNAVVSRRLAYDVDLTDPARPLATLTVTHQNGASPDVPCIQWGGERPAGQKYYPIDACYWNYMRLYVPAGATLLSATPQGVPHDWMVLGHGVSGEVDRLDETVEGLQGYGALMVVPGGGARTSTFELLLPAGILQPGADGGQLRYALTVRKQPGLLTTPLTIRIHLPSGASLDPAGLPRGAVLEGNHLLIESDMRRDLHLRVDFRLD